MASYSGVVVVGIMVCLVSAVAGQDAPAPSSTAGPANLTAILEKGGQFSTLIRLLQVNRVDEQIRNQLNNSVEGLTVLAPTDNAFNNLKAGALNNLSTQDQVNLLLFHVLPKYYSLDDLLTVSNPVRTQYSQDGLNFTGQGRDLNVSSGLVQTRLNNALRQQRPLAVYQLDAVLLPPSFNSPRPAPPPSSTPAATPNPKNTSNNDSSSPSSSPDSSAAAAAATPTTAAAAAFAFLLSLLIASSF